MGTTEGDSENKLSEAEELQERHTLTRIATDIQQRQGSFSATQDGDPRLDPTSSSFDHYRWAQVALESLNKAGIRMETQGVAFSGLTVFGSGAHLQVQHSVVTALLQPFRLAASAIFAPRSASNSRRKILHEVDGLLQSGELLLVLGRPGSGCTTLLKSMCGLLDGLKLDPSSQIQYQGISFETMLKNYRGDVAYNQEVDQHFAHLTVGQTLSFAAAARIPQQRQPGVTRAERIATMVQVVMAIFGLSHTYNTKVGDSFVRGVSGGERKRVSIAEMFLSGARIGAWDNSTRGLDSSTALKFISSLRLSADLGRSCHAVAAYQASQSMYEIFDKVTVMYDGYQIYYGSRDRAVAYFEGMGWYRDPRQTSPDFLTAVTNPGERKPRDGMEAKVPRTATEFAQVWRNSQDFKELQEKVKLYQQTYPPGEAREFRKNHVSRQAKHSRPSSPYLLSISMQLRLCMTRSVQRMRNDMPTTMSTVMAQLVLSFIIGSIFYQSPNTSSAFFQKGAVIFFSVLMNALITITEIMQLYVQRPVVEKQARYAFVHPFTEALAGVVTELPIKLMRCSFFSIVLYFLVGLRKDAGHFFVFYLFLIIMILTMSGIFRTAAAITRTMGQAMSIAGVLILAIIVDSGFMIPQAYLHPWFGWIRWINPIFYAFEALLSNEFHDRDFQCAQLVPPYGKGDSVICAAVGAVPGQLSLSGDAFLDANYGYQYAHLWRNFGILVAFVIFFHVTYLSATEFNKGKAPKGETLVFRPGHGPSAARKQDTEQAISQDASDSSPRPVEVDTQALGHMAHHTDVLTWKCINYDIPVKKGTRRLLTDVNGWVKPGTLTALMGVSGAGKTTLLDVLAQRTSIGVVDGDILVSGKLTTSGFPRSAGYVQQQDLHLETTTVREALRFSATLRQPRSVSEAEKQEYVEEVIRMLGMQDFAEAVVGILGEGLNVEQRKLLSIGVELAAKPSLLIFLDEPTSGLDSQSSWTIISLLRRLADSGQAVLATIHQPSALIFQQFDRLLFLTTGGRTVYFGNLGPQFTTLLDYFARVGARPCGHDENPAEYMLDITSDRDKSGIDLVSEWNHSNEKEEVMAELDRLCTEKAVTPHHAETNDELSKEFALPLHSQFYYVAARAFQQYYRQPEYILSKFTLGIASGLFIGFSFWKASQTQQGFQNAMFSIFLLATIFPTLVNQIMPKFVVQRSLYEVRERPSRVYSWKVFILSQVLVEAPWQLLLGICAWACFFFPVFGTESSPETKGLVLLFVVQFYMYAATIAQMVVAAIPDPALGSMIAILLFGLSFIFNGVMQPPDALPGFWIFMWRVSPFTYFVSGVLGAALHGRKVICSDAELSVLNPPLGQTCGSYLAKFLAVAPGTLNNPEATSKCEYCPLSSADQYLAVRRVYWDQRWRNYGIFICYMAFNIFAMVSLYYIFRVRTWQSRQVKKN